MHIMEQRGAEGATPSAPSTSFQWTGAHSAPRLFPRQGGDYPSWFAVDDQRLIKLHDISSR
jgi:hypothetical protein